MMRSGRLLVFFTFIFGLAPLAAAQTSETTYLEIAQLRDILMKDLGRPILWKEFDHDLQARRITYAHDASEVEVSAERAAELVLANGFMLLQLSLDARGPLTLITVDDDSELGAAEGRLVTEAEIMSGTLFAAEFVFTILPLERLDCLDARRLALQMGDSYAFRTVKMVDRANALILAGRVDDLASLIRYLRRLEALHPPLELEETVEAGPKTFPSQAWKSKPVAGEATWVYDLAVPFMQGLLWSHFNTERPFSTEEIGMAGIDWNAGTPLVPKDASAVEFSRMMQERCLSNGYSCTVKEKSDTPVLLLIRDYLPLRLMPSSQPFDYLDREQLLSNPATGWLQERQSDIFGREESWEIIEFIVGGSGYIREVVPSQLGVVARAATQVRLADAFAELERLARGPVARHWRELKKKK